MNKIISFVKRYPLSLCCVALIWYLCIWFMPPEFPELENVAFLDKWTHFVMYGGFCGTIWWEYLRCHNRLNGWRLFLLAWLAPAAMSGVIELVQAYCTVNRAGEWLDLAANVTGCTLGTIVGLVMAKFS
jgi:VanZ family protein